MNNPSPTLCGYDEWSPEFINFVDHCLEKIPELRPTCQEILTKHKKFFDKAVDITYIKEHFIKNLKPLE